MAKKQTNQYVEVRKKTKPDLSGMITRFKYVDKATTLEKAQHEVRL